MNSVLLFPVNLKLLSYEFDEIHTRENQNRIPTKNTKQLPRINACCVDEVCVLILPPK